MKWPCGSGEPQGLFFFEGVISSGFEPETHSLEGCCSIQLSYETKPLLNTEMGVIFRLAAAKVQKSFYDST